MVNREQFLRHLLLYRSVFLTSVVCAPLATPLKSYGCLESRLTLTSYRLLPHHHDKNNQEKHVQERKVYLVPWFQKMAPEALGPLNLSRLFCGSSFWRKKAVCNTVGRKQRAAGIGKGQYFSHDPLPSVLLHSARPLLTRISAASPNSASVRVQAGYKEFSSQPFLPLQKSCPV